MRDLNKYNRGTNIRLIVGAVILIFLIGDGLIFIIYGSGPAGMGLICLFVGLFPVLLIACVIFLLNWSVKRANRE
jgi:hypothetical protein